MKRLILLLICALYVTTAAQAQISFYGEWCRKGSGEKTIMIFDMKEKKAYVMNEARKTCMVMEEIDKLSTNKLVGYDWEVSHSTSREFLGMEEIDGKECAHYYVKSESIYKDGGKEHIGSHRPADPWRGEKYLPYEGGHRVPFIVSWPGVIPGGTSAALVSLVDLAATFAALRGVEVPQGALPDSFDQSAALLNPAAPSARTSLICQDYALSLRDGHWKYILPRGARNLPSRAKNPLAGELYDLKADPKEAHNVVRDFPDRARAMYAALLQAERTGRTRP